MIRFHKSEIFIKNIPKLCVWCKEQFVFYNQATYCFCLNFYFEWFNWFFYITKNVVSLGKFQLNWGNFHFYIFLQNLLFYYWVPRSPSWSCRWSEWMVQSVFALYPIYTQNCEIAILIVSDKYCLIFSKIWRGSHCNSTNHHRKLRYRHQIYLSFPPFFLFHWNRKKGQEQFFILSNFIHKP